MDWLSTRIKIWLLGAAVGGGLIASALDLYFFFRYGGLFSLAGMSDWLMLGAPAGTIIAAILVVLLRRRLNDRP